MILEVIEDTKPFAGLVGEAAQALALQDPDDFTEGFRML